jgi:hypothetical protein
MKLPRRRRRPGIHLPKNDRISRLGKRLFSTIVSLFRTQTKQRAAIGIRDTTALAFSQITDIVIPVLVAHRIGEDLDEVHDFSLVASSAA